MLISVKAHVTDAIEFLDRVHHRHIPFASIYAATLTAREVKEREVDVMQRVFDRPTPYVLNALRVKPATFQDNTATVEFKDFAGKGTPAKRFINPNVHGGGRAQKSHELKLMGLTHSAFMIPGRDLPRDGYGNVRGSVFARILSQLKVSSDATQHASGSKRSKGRRKADAYFVSKRGFVLNRKTTGRGKGKSDQLSVVMAPIKAPHYQKRFPFYETGEAVVADRFPANFVTALERAISTSNRRGKW